MLVFLVALLLRWGSYLRLQWFCCSLSTFSAFSVIYIYLWFPPLDRSDIMHLFFKFLHEIFDDVASLWVKHRAKPTDESKAQQFKFRERAFNIESIINIDVSNCAILLANDSFSEWQELLAEELDEKVPIFAVPHANPTVTETRSILSFRCCIVVLVLVHL